MPTEKQVQKAIKALEAAWQALEPITTDDPRDGVTRLRSDINEYVSYLEQARWWRRK